MSPRWTLTGKEDGVDPTDARLLTDFASGDEGAFGALVERHGAMVYAAALRRLADHADAEDASQAVFIILARKAGSIRRGAMLSPWLWRTTGFVCRNMHKERARRRAREEAVRSEATARDAEEAIQWDEVSPRLDEAIESLPARAREAVVLHYLGGRSREDAAREIGISVDAFRKRLEYGIEKLRGRLARSGAALSVSGLAAALAANAVIAIPPAVAVSIKAAGLGAVSGTAVSAGSYALAKGAMKMMFIAKMKVAAAVIAVTVAAGTGTGVVVAKAMEGGSSPDTARGGKVVTGARYVSPDGKASWNRATKKAAPCSPQTAFQSAKAGDTVYFLGGVYRTGQSSGYKGVWGPANSGTKGKPIVFAALGGEKVVMEGAPELRGGGRKRNYRLTTRPLGNQYQSYIVFDGFHFVAKDRVGFCGIIISRGCDHKEKPEAWAKGCIVRNCTFDGGKFAIGSHPDDNPNSGDNNEAIRIEETDGTLVQNCRMWNFKHVKDNHNISAVKTYHNRNMVIENCEIYDSSVAIFAKSNSDDSIFRNNYIHDCRTAYDFTAFGWKSKSPNRADGYWTSDSSRCRIENNVIVDCPSAVSVFAQDSANIDGLVIAGNTICRGKIGLTDTADAEIYNNILSGYSRLGLDYNRQKIKLPMAAVDHNQWGPNKGSLLNVWVKGRKSSLRYNLAKWQASGEMAGKKNPGEGSLISDPGFVNKSGTLKKLDDFRLSKDSPCLKAGRDGADMGADVGKVGLRK